MPGQSSFHPAVTNRDGTVNYAQQQITGIGQPGSAITLADNGNPLASSTIRADGTWSASATLLSGSNDIVATDTDPAGGTGQSRTFHIDVDLSKKSDKVGPNLGFDPDATMSSATAATLSGTIDDPDGFLNSVDVYSDGAPIGQGSVAFDGASKTWRWSYDFDQGAGTFKDIEVHAVDTAFAKSAAACPFELVTGIIGEPYSAEQITRLPDGSIANTAYYRADGALAYSGTTSPDGAGGAETVLTGATGSVRFGIDPAVGHTEVRNFKAAGPDHDTLVLGDAGLHSMKQVMGHASTVAGDTTIHLDSGASITLDGVSKASLRAHPGDFAFG